MLFHKIIHFPSSDDAGDDDDDPENVRLFLYFISFISFSFRSKKQSFIFRRSRDFIKMCRFFRWKLGWTTFEEKTSSSTSIEHSDGRNQCI